MSISVLLTAVVVVASRPRGAGTYTALLSQCVEAGGTWAEVEGISQCWR